MALKDQPYLPLYVKDFLTDERLVQCSASSYGVYIVLMCLMHKSDVYGAICLRQKDMQNLQQKKGMIEIFAGRLHKAMPFSIDVICFALNELIDEGVIKIEGNNLVQKRMYKDGQISLMRSDIGKDSQFAKANKQTKGKAKKEQNTVIANGNVNESVINKKKASKNFVPPSVQEVENYFEQKGYKKEIGTKAFEYYSPEWIDSRGSKVLNWKQKMISVWFKDENKSPEANADREYSTNGL